MHQVPSNLLEGYEFIDLFCGIGGFHLALSSYGAKCVYASDIDPYARQTYEMNFNIKPIGDIRRQAEDTIPKHDILCAGFPCQAFSISGKQRGFADDRGTLFFDVARITKYHKPSIVFLENVKNFEKHDNGKTLRVITNILDNIGYNVFYKVLNAAKYGVPQKRERIYIVGIRKDHYISDFIFPKPMNGRRHVEDILETENEQTEKMYVKREDITITDPEDDRYDDEKPIRLGFIGKGGQGERIYSTKGIGITLSAHGGGIFAKTGGYKIADEKYRKLTVREAARMMGFPDSYIPNQSDSQAYKQFGNSVVVDVLQKIASGFADILKQ